MQIVIYYLLKKQDIQYFKIYKKTYLSCFLLAILFSIIISFMTYKTALFYLLLIIEFIGLSLFSYLVLKTKCLNDKVKKDLINRIKNNSLLTIGEYNYLKSELLKQSIKLIDQDYNAKSIIKQINKQI